jgi:hypothetical protein
LINKVKERKHILYMRANEQNKSEGRGVPGAGKTTGGGVVTGEGRYHEFSKTQNSFLEAP